MANTKILKNETASPVNITDTGVTVPASGQYVIPPQDFLIWAASANVITYVSDLAVGPSTSTLTVNDGSDDLGISDGVDLIKGIFQKNRIIGDSDATLIGNIGDELKTTNRIRGGTDATLIGNEGDALKVSGLVFEGEDILTSPRLDYQAFLNMQTCIFRNIEKQLRIMNQQLTVLTDLDMECISEDEPGSADF